MDGRFFTPECVQGFGVEPIEVQPMYDIEDLLVFRRVLGNLVQQGHEDRGESQVELGHLKEMI